MGKIELETIVMFLLALFQGDFCFFNLSLATVSHCGPVFSLQFVRHDFFLVLVLSYFSVKIT